MSPPHSQVAALTEQDLSVTDDLSEIIEGLSRQQKTLSPKFFYDERGSKLFDAICELPEYYLTRTELSIMQANMDEIVTLVGPHASLFEFGSGSSLKTHMLLKALDRIAAYVPVDISKEHLLAAAESIAAKYPDIEVWPVLADFMQPFQLPNPTVMPIKNIVYFPGSTIGNFSPEDAHRLLQVMHLEAGENGALLIGVDLQKDRDVIELAYNDSSGVTAEFNVNMLRRINREFGANFNVDLFEHRAVYNEEHGRMELYLVSQCEQLVRISGQSIRFVKGEALLTEHSHKYTLDQFDAMVKRAGFDVDTVWTDPERLFSVQYCLRK